MSFGKLGSLGKGFGNFGLLGGAGIPPQAQALFARYTTPPTSAQQSAISAAFKASISSGAFGLLDFWHMFNAATEQQAWQNWVQNAFNLTKVGSPTFTANSNYQGNGSNTALNTGLIPSSFGGQFSLNSATLGVMILDPQSVATIMAEIGSGTNTAVGQNSANLFYPISAGSGPPDPGTAACAGLVTIVRRSSASVDVYIGAVKVGTAISSASTSLSAAVVRYLASSTTWFSSRRVAGGYGGAAMSDAQVASMAAAFHANMKASGGYSINKQFVCLGNSLTEGEFSTNPATDNWPTVMQGLYGSTVNTTSNTFGFPGDTTPMLAGFLTTNQALRAASQFPANKRILFFWEMINDISNNAATPAQCVTNYQVAVAAARLQGYDKIIVANLIDTARFVRTPYNTAMTAAWPGFADGYVDFTNIPQLSDHTNTTYYYTDGTHLTTAGYAVVATVMKAAADLYAP